MFGGGFDKSRDKALLTGCLMDHRREHSECFLLQLEELFSKYLSHWGFCVFFFSLNLGSHGHFLERLIL